MLVSLLVGIAIIGILVVVSMQTFSNAMQAHKLVERKGQLEDLRRLFRVSVSCSKTLAGKSCNNQTVTLLRSDGKALGSVKNGKTTIGSYALVAKCDKKTSGEIHLSVTAKGKNDSTSAPLFDQIPFVCPAPP